MTEITGHELGGVLKCAKSNYTDAKTDIGLPVEPTAAALGLKIVTATSYHLQLDLDSPEAFDRFEENFALLDEHFKRIGWEMQRLLTVSKSGNTHVYIRIVSEGIPGAAAQSFDIQQRIALQAALGSDGKRELLNLVRYYDDVDTRDNVVLFETPEEYIKVMDFLYPGVAAPNRV
jgi:hypothetical protein